MIVSTPECSSSTITLPLSRISYHLVPFSSETPHVSMEYLAFYSWLVVWNMDFIFPYIGNNHPN